ncbi:hypothetical protein BaRGS_00015262 [Batillaria attramentaria]|uniref:Uncharacterized protein n=1 Tax=Batillaria attramentaria TaxID=370345 RepID=A0ABD0L2T5_9CAEN
MRPGTDAQIGDGAFSKGGLERQAREAGFSGWRSKVKTDVGTCAESVQSARSCPQCADQKLLLHNARAWGGGGIDVGEKYIATGERQKSSCQ